MRAPGTSVLLRALGVLVVLAVVAAVVVTVVVVRSSGDDGPSGPTITTLEELAAAEVSVSRGSFCDRVRVGGVLDALDGSVTSVRDYENGDTVQFDPATRDVAHEFGCTWTSGDGTVARAWIFAPPVTTARARRLTKLAASGDGCATYAGGAFGDPGAAYTCAAGGRVLAGRGGLFGDAWLSCTIAKPTETTPDEAADLQARADRWCVTAAVAAAGVDR